MSYNIAPWPGRIYNIIIMYITIMYTPNIFGRSWRTTTTTTTVTVDCANKDLCKYAHCEWAQIIVFIDYNQLLLSVVCPPVDDILLLLLSSRYLLFFPIFVSVCPPYSPSRCRLHPSSSPPLRIYFREGKRRL